MIKITIDMIKDLRVKTGAGVMDCHAALTKCEGNQEAAEKLIKDERHARPVEMRPCGTGVVHSYVHMGNRIGVMVEVECGTDFAARTNEFRTFVHDLAMHIAALNPLCISPEDAPWDTKEDREMVDSSRYLLLQPFVKDGTQSIGDLLSELSDRIGEPCSIRRFIRWEVGEDIQQEEIIQPLDKPKGPMIAAAVVILLGLAISLGLMLFL